MLVIRLVLSLRQAGKRNADGSISLTTIFRGIEERAMAFNANSALGNIGASLAVNDEELYGPEPLEELPPVELLPMSDTSPECAEGEGRVNF